MKQQKCCNCGLPMNKSNNLYGRPICSRQSCKAVRARARRATERKEKPTVPCFNCGDAVDRPQRYSGQKVACSKEVCRTELDAEKKEKARITAREKYAEKMDYPSEEVTEVIERNFVEPEWNAFNEAVVRDVFLPIVKPPRVRMDGKYANPCDACRWVDHCTERVKVSLWLSCEFADERDKQRLEKSELSDRMYLLLEEAKVY